MENRPSMCAIVMDAVYSGEYEPLQILANALPHRYYKCALLRRVITAFFQEKDPHYRENLKNVMKVVSKALQNSPLHDIVYFMKYFNELYFHVNKYQVCDVMTYFMFNMMNEEILNQEESIDIVNQLCIFCTSQSFMDSVTDIIGIKRINIVTQKCGNYISLLEEI